MIGDVKMQTIERRTGQSLTNDRPLLKTVLSTYQNTLPKNDQLEYYNIIIRSDFRLEHQTNTKQGFSLVFISSIHSV